GVIRLEVVFGNFFVIEIDADIVALRHVAGFDKPGLGLVKWLVEIHLYRGITAEVHHRKELAAVSVQPDIAEGGAQVDARALTSLFIDTETKGQIIRSRSIFTGEDG